MDFNTRTTLIKLLKQTLTYFSDDGFSLQKYQKTSQHSLHSLLFDEGGIISELNESIPIEVRDTYTNNLKILATASAWDRFSISNNDSSALLQDIRKTINDVIYILEGQTLNIVNVTTAVKKRRFMVFYCWQSDVSNKYNRSFIESAIKTAIKNINNCKGIDYVLDFDKDTLNEPGSPDIFNTILEKISRCNVFIADVTPIAFKKRKALPNPNVLIELGYAFNHLGDMRILMIANSSYCKNNKHMPFDLDTKRFFRYCCSRKTSTDNKQKEKKELIDYFEMAIKLIISKST